MHNIATKDIKRLKKKTEKNAVTIYIPLESGANNIRTNTSKLNATIKQVRDRLKFEGVSGRDIDLISANARKLKQMLVPESTQGTMLGFVTPKSVESFVTPIDLDWLVYIDDHFYVSPIETELSGARHALVLTLSQHGAKVYEATNYMIKELSDQEIKQDLGEMLSLDELVMDLNNHAVSGVPGAQATDRFHGHDKFHDEKKDRILDYFRAIDKKLHALVRDKQLPVILVGVEYLLPLYRKASSHRKYISDVVANNAAHMRPNELHKLVEPLLA